LEKGTHGADENQKITETEFRGESETCFEKRESVEQIEIESSEIEIAEIESAFHQYALENPREIVDGQSKKPLDARPDESPRHGRWRDHARGRRRHGCRP
jgi:hypothetical protein